jgi:hypothetical protein
MGVLSHRQLTTVLQHHDAQVLIDQLFEMANPPRQ